MSPLLFVFTTAFAAPAATPTPTPAPAAAAAPTPAASKMALPAWPSQTPLAAVFDVHAIPDRAFTSATLSLEKGLDGDGIVVGAAARSSVATFAPTAPARSMTRAELLAALDPVVLRLAPTNGDRTIKLRLTVEGEKDPVEVESTLGAEVAAAEPTHIRRAGKVDPATELPLATALAPAADLTFEVDGAVSKTWKDALAAFHTEMTAPNAGAAPVARTLVVADATHRWTVARLVVHPELSVPNAACFTTWISTRYHSRPWTRIERAARIVRYDEHLDRLRLEVGVGMPKGMAVQEEPVDAGTCRAAAVQYRMVVSLRPLSGDAAKDKDIPTVSTPWMTTQQDVSRAAAGAVRGLASEGLAKLGGLAPAGQGNRAGVAMRAAWEELQSAEAGLPDGKKWSGGTMKEMDGKTNGAFSYHVRVEVNDDPEHLPPIVVRTAEHVLRVDLDEAVTVAIAHDVAQTGVLLLGCDDINKEGDSTDVSACVADPKKLVTSVVESTSPLGVRVSWDPFYYSDMFAFSAQVTGPSLGSSQTLTGASAIDSELGLTAWGSFTLGADIRATDNSFARLGLGAALVQGEAGTVVRPFLGLSYTITSADSDKDTETKNTGSTNADVPADSKKK